MSTSSRDAQIKRDACQFGLVRCHRIDQPARYPDTQVLDQEARNLDAWSWLLQAARLDREARVESREPSAPSLSFAAQDYGLVPHPEHTECTGCPSRQAARSRAADLIGWEYRHPWAEPEHTWASLRFHPTAWSVAQTTDLR